MGGYVHLYLTQLNKCPYFQKFFSRFNSLFWVIWCPCLASSFIFTFFVGHRRAQKRVKGCEWLPPKLPWTFWETWQILFNPIKNYTLSHFCTTPCTILIITAQKHVCELNRRCWTSFSLCSSKHTKNIEIYGFSATGEGGPPPPHPHTFSWSKVMYEFMLSCVLSV